MGEMANFFQCRNTFAMFVPHEMSDYNNSSYADGRNEARISVYPAVPYMVCHGILYDPIGKNSIWGSIPQSPRERFW